MNFKITNNVIFTAYLISLSRLEIQANNGYE